MVHVHSVGSCTPEMQTNWEITIRNRNQMDNTNLVDIFGVADAVGVTRESLGANNASEVAGEFVPLLVLRQFGRIIEHIMTDLKCTIQSPNQPDSIDSTHHAGELDSTVAGQKC